MNIGFSMLSYGRDVFGGIENSIFNLIKGLRAQSHHCFVYSGTLSGTESLIEETPVFRSSALPMSLKGSNEESDRFLEQHIRSNSTEIVAELLQFEKQYKLDALVTVDPLWGIVLCSGAWKSLSCPVVISHHVVGQSHLLDQAAAAPFKLRRTVSPILKSQLETQTPNTTYTVIPNSVDNTLFSPRERQQPSSCRAFFCNSRIDKGKGIDLLLDAFERFLMRGYSYELRLCGGGSPFGDRAAVIDRIEGRIHTSKLLRANVKILPPMKWSEVPKVMGSSFAVVLPSEYESFGRAALEAMSLGTPVIAIGGGNLENLIGTSGLMAEGRSADALADAMAHLVKDASLYSELERRGPEVAMRYSNNVIAQGLVNHIVKWID